MPASRSAPVEPSGVSIVFTTLCTIDDFVSVGHLVTASGLTPKLVRTSLVHLRSVNAVCAVESGGVLYWGATPECDQRMRTIDVRRKEDEPRHHRQRRTPRTAL